MAIAELIIYPLDKGVSLSKYVAEIIDIIDNSGIDYLLTPMGTIIEGSFEEIMGISAKCFHHLEKNSDRISFQLKIDYRKGQNNAKQNKIKSIEDKLNRKIKSTNNL